MKNQEDKGLKNIIKIILKCLLVFVLLVVAVNLIGPALPAKLTEEQKEQIGKTEYESEEAGNERILCVDDNNEALLWRLRMIESAREKIIFSTFDFREDDSGTDVMAALYCAAERGVKVQILLDDLNRIVQLGNSDLFRVLCSHENIEVKSYNTVSLKNIFRENYRMHDKYLIIDDEMYLLGGRNTNDIFLGDTAQWINIDREILVYETEPGKGESFLQLMDYFTEIWNESGADTLKPSVKKEKLKECSEILKSRNASVCRENSAIKNYDNWIEDTYPANKITLIDNGVAAKKKKPVMLYELEYIMKQGTDVVIQTPYVICDNNMYEVLSNVSRSADVKIILNAVERGSNPWGCTDYMNNKKNIMKQGVTLYELMNEDAVHTKTILVDDNISVVGSYNWDARSTYLDTELMLVIDSKELNRHIRELNETYMEKSIEVLPDGTETVGAAYQGVELSDSKKWFYRILRVVIRPIRYLL